MKKFRRTVLIAAALLLIASSFAFASQIVFMTPGDMGERAHLVVRGEVAAVRSFWNEKRTKIFTRTTITIEHAYKGNAVPTVEILQLGGIVGNVKVTVDGALQWAQGEEVLLFLEPYTAGAYQVTGFSQGKFAIERDPETGEAYISRPALEGVELVTLGDDSVTADKGRMSKVPLDRFVADALAGTK